LASRVLPRLGHSIFRFVPPSRSLQELRISSSCKNTSNLQVNLLVLNPKPSKRCESKRRFGHQATPYNLPTSLLSRWQLTPRQPIRLIPLRNVDTPFRCVPSASHSVDTDQWLGASSTNNMGVFTCSSQRVPTRNQPLVRLLWCPFCIEHLVFSWTYLFVLPNVPPSHKDQPPTSFRAHLSCSRAHLFAFRSVEDSFELTFAVPAITYFVIVPIPSFWTSLRCSCLRICSSCNIENIYQFGFSLPRRNMYSPRYS
jgi:hypothetical protein